MNRNSIFIYFISLLVVMIITKKGFGQNYTTSHQSYSIFKPQLVGPGTVSTGENEMGFTISPDGRTALWCIGGAKWFNTIVLSHKLNGHWTKPIVASFSGQYSDADPLFSPDGKSVYFMSKRPISGNMPKNDWDLWVVKRINGQFGKPHNLGKNINTNHNESHASITKSGILYFSSDRPAGKGGSDIYLSVMENGKLTKAMPIKGPINSKYTEADPGISPNGKYLVFMGFGYKNGYGRSDLYISVKKNGMWTKPQNLGRAINSSDSDFSPYFSSDNRWFYFTSMKNYSDKPQVNKQQITYPELKHRLDNPGNGYGDVYKVSTAFLLDQF